MSNNDKKNTINDKFLLNFQPAKKILHFKFTNKLIIRRNYDISRTSMFKGAMSSGVFSERFVNNNTQAGKKDDKQQMTRKRRFGWCRDALTPRYSSTGANGPWTPGTSCSQFASSVRPCPWWRVYWDP